MRYGGRMITALFIVANIAVVAILGGLAYVLNWSGPGFAAGCLAGFSVAAFYLRIRLGYWP